MDVVFAELLSGGKRAQRLNLLVYWYQGSAAAGTLPEQTHGTKGFIQTRGATPCTENKIYFPLLLLYVKLERFQSSQLLESLFRSAKVEGLFCTKASTHACCHVETFSLCSVLTRISSCISCFSLLLRLLYKLVLYLRV